MGNCLNSSGGAAKRLEETIQHDSDDDDAKYGANRMNKGNKSHNKAIEKYMKDIAQKENEVIKILLLGSGSSGKSTLFRQIECIHGAEDDENENENDNNNNNHNLNYPKDSNTSTKHDMDRFFVNIASMKRTIRYNSMGGLIKLLQKSDLLSKPPYNLEKCIIDFNDETIENAIKLLVSFAKTTNHESDDQNADDLADLGKAMNLLWNLDGIKETFKHRQYFSLTENMDYFLDKITNIMDESEENRYEPSMEDILNARMQTTGIIERVYFIQKVQFNIFDVGGQRNERRKWIQLFDKVNGLIFVAALNHYCCVLFEDETINAMQESLQLFDEILNAKWFSSKHTQFILFLNKNDLFIQRLKIDRIPLSICFNDLFSGPNYNDKTENEFETEQERDEWFADCYQESIQFIKQQYLSKNRNKRITSIFTHVTTATEKSNIQRVFDDVRMGIISQSLATSGFHVDMQSLMSD